MVDRDRVLVKLEELGGYVLELKQAMPKDIKSYRNSTVKRACERLLQLCIEATIDICKKIVLGNRLGVPKDEPDLFEKLRQAGVLTDDMLVTLREMRSLRNVLIHEYADIDDERIYEVLTLRLGDFEKFRQAILAYLK